MTEIGKRHGEEEGILDGQRRVNRGTGYARDPTSKDAEVSNAESSAGYAATHLKEKEELNAEDAETRREEKTEFLGKKRDATLAQEEVGQQCRARAKGSEKAS